MYTGRLHRTRTRSGNFILMKKKEKETGASFKQIQKFVVVVFPWQLQWNTVTVMTREWLGSERVGVGRCLPLLYESVTQTEK